MWLKPGLLLPVVALAASFAAAAMAQQRPTQPAPQPASPPAAAQSDEPFRVATIDIQAILRQAAAAEGLQRRMQIEQDRYQARADELQRQLQEEEAAVEQERSKLSAEDFAQRRRDFQDRVNRTTLAFRERRRRIDEAFNSASAEINRTLLAVIEELALEQGIQLVVRREAVLYQRAVLDLTKAAARALNERLPEVTVDVPPESP